MGYDYTVDMDYMDLTDCCPGRAVKHNHSLQFNKLQPGAPLINMGLF